MSNTLRDYVGPFVESAVPIVKPGATAKEVEKMLRDQANQFATINYIYIVSPKHELVGVLSVQELFHLKPGDTVNEFIGREIITARIHSRCERVAELALKHQIKAVPVLSREHRFLGVVPSDKIFEILNIEHTKDILHLVGVTHKEGEGVLLEGSPFLHFKRRLPWLILGLLGGVLAAAVVGSFEDILAEQLILAAFIPAMVYIADAVGTQTEMLFVRALSLNQNLSVGKYFMREIIISSLLGVVLGGLIFAVSYLWIQSFIVSSILAISILLNVVATVFIAIILPWLVKLRGFDPAVASGPLATVMCDIMSLCIYLLVASALLL